ncbi:MAG: hypothetical protein ACTHMS_19640 [Jatrophihabitans sp.]|uniref:hypothetical protein n=1 Tax=Jatrophihabitans sp. TaxID=1932789 RepID=UPI003F8175F0
MRGPSPLLRAAPGRVFAEPLRGLLLLAVFGLTAAAGVSEPLYLQHAGNAAFDQARADIQPGVNADDPNDVVRVVFPDSPFAKVASGLLRDLDHLPHLDATELSAGSITRELDTSATYGSVVSVGKRQQRVRLFAVDRPAQRLRAEGPTASTPGGVWLPSSVATALKLRVGTPVTLSITLPTAPGSPKSVTRSAQAPFAGAYAVDRHSASPVDPAGSVLWSDRHGQLPTDSLTGDNADLLVTDPATAVRLSAATQDQLQWVAQRRLLPHTTLGQATATVAAVKTFSDAVEVLPSAVSGPTPLRVMVLSGIAGLTGPAHDEVAATSGPMRSLALATAGLGLVALFGITALTVRRRRDELRHAAFLGISPFTLALHGAVECLVPMVVAATGAVLVGIAVSPQWGAAFTDGIRITAALCGGALALIAATTVVAAVVWSTPESVPSAARRGRAAVPAAIAAALGAVVISLYGDHGASVSSWLALLIPVVGLLAVGAIAGYVLVGAAQRASRCLPAGVPDSTRGRFAVRLALRRLAAGGLLVVLIVAGLTTAIGMLLFARTSTAATVRAVADRTAVSVGARTVVTIDGSALLDPTAPAARPSAQGHDPTPPSGSTLVWNTQVDTIDGVGSQQLVVISPRTFPAVASWGSGRELAAARAETATFVRGPGATARPIVPVLAIGLDHLRDGTTFASTVGFQPVIFTVVGHAALYPGLRFGLVTTSTSLFPRLGAYDPRLAPPHPLSATQYSGFGVSVWSRHGLGELRRQLGGIEIGSVSTAAQIEDSPVYRSARDAVDYRELLTACLVVLGAAGVILFVERTAASARVSELMLVVSGLRASGVLTARLLEIVGWVLAAVGAAVASVLVLSTFSSRLLEFGGGDPPPLYVHVSAHDLLSVALAACVGAAALLATISWTTRRRVALEAMRGE